MPLLSPFDLVPALAAPTIPASLWGLPCPGLDDRAAWYERPAIGTPRSSAGDGGEDEADDDTPPVLERPAHLELAATYAPEGILVQGVCRMCGGRAEGLIDLSQVPLLRDVVPGVPRNSPLPAEVYQYAPWVAEVVCGAAGHLLDTWGHAHWRCRLKPRRHRLHRDLRPLRDALVERNLMFLSAGIAVERALIVVPPTGAPIWLDGFEDLSPMPPVAGPTAMTADHREDGAIRLISGDLSAEGSDEPPEDPEAEVRQAIARRLARVRHVIRTRCEEQAPTAVAITGWRSYLDPTAPDHGPQDVFVLAFVTPKVTHWFSAPIRWLGRRGGPAALDPVGETQLRRPHPWVTGACPTVPLLDTETIAARILGDL